MPSYTLHYFNARARAETIRFIFAYSDTPYEDKRWTKDEFQSFKPKTPFGQMPVLECDGKLLAQGQAIARFLAKQTGLYGKNDWESAEIDSVMDQCNDMLRTAPAIMMENDPIKKEILKKKFKDETVPHYLTIFEKYLTEHNSSGHFVGNRFTVADFEFTSNVTRVKGFGIEMDPSKFPRCKAVVDKVCSQPKIAKWIATRPDTKM